MKNSVGLAGQWNWALERSTSTWCFQTRRLKGTLTAETRGRVFSQGQATWCLAAPRGAETVGSPSSSKLSRETMNALASSLTCTSSPSRRATEIATSIWLESTSARSSTWQLTQMVAQCTLTARHAHPTWPRSTISKTSTLQVKTERRDCSQMTLYSTNSARWTLITPIRSRYPTEGWNTWTIQSLSVNTKRAKPLFTTPPPINSLTWQSAIIITPRRSVDASAKS